ncbi:hypothetical protein SAMN04488003_11042 [Loktanella fryxellensis]|uniref:Transglycosylase SLT domain-containing protein n=1 Tax=Loktanella fryxellensis TaxID=245187 RepID=A0A1H8E9I0_9RHOB|nr:lytic transglycosylase [Loktanella fryxellensis]SEN16145.1 hypothetical protein SAMN04488003_11042 [Loktanella fryxellensis]
MSSFFRALVLLALLGSCGSREFTAPRDLENACNILSERPEYRRAFKRVEDRYGVPMPALMAIIYQESKFIGNNRPPHQFALGVIPIGRQSSATGYSQALDGTWDEYVVATGNRRAKREDIHDATDFMGWYMTATVRETGVQMTDVRNQYLAYHDGRSGFMRGTWRSKDWLIRVASDVEARALRYDTQLRACRKR